MEFLKNFLDEVPGGIFEMDFLEESPDRISGRVLNESLDGIQGGAWNGTPSGIFEWDSWSNPQA